MFQSVNIPWASIALFNWGVRVVDDRWRFAFSLGLFLEKNADLPQIGSAPRAEVVYHHGTRVRYCAVPNPTIQGRTRLGNPIGDGGGDNFASRIFPIRSRFSPDGCIKIRPITTCADHSDKSLKQRIAKTTYPWDFPSSMSLGPVDIPPMRPIVISTGSLAPSDRVSVKAPNR